MGRIGFAALITLIALVPAWADVYITAAQVGDTNEVIISFDATSETNLVRAFALDIKLDNDANIVSVIGLSADYWVYPGTIQIDASGNVTDYGTIAGEYGDLPGDTLPGPPDGNGVTLECASLYAPVGPGSPNAPAKSGDLASIIVDADTCLTISANVARAGSTGVVMENPDEVVTVNYPVQCVEVNFPKCIGECVKLNAPFYHDWEVWEKPACWCYARQCRGDINGTFFLGKPVTGADLIIFKSAFNKTDAELALVPNGICADLNHTSFLGKRVTGADLIIFKTYFNQLEANVPECDMTHFCVWESP